MADAEIIDFTREPAGPGTRHSRRAEPLTEPDAPEVEEPTESSRSDDPVGLLSDLAHLAGQSVAALSSIPIRALRQLTSDPVRAALTVAQRLGVAWPVGLDDAVDSRERGCRVTTRSMSSASIPNSPNRSSCPC